MTRRTERVGEVIKQEVSNVILHKLQDPRVSLVTVTNVMLSPDLRMAKIYVTIIGDESARKTTLDALNHAKGFIRTEMASHLKMRNTPSISFFLDCTKEKSNQIFQLIEKAVKEEEK